MRTENIIFHDGASNSSEISFSTTCEQTKGYQRPLRRRNTVTTLKRWASKRVSRASFSDAHGNELSEKNLISLDMETRYIEADNDATMRKQFELGEITEQNPQDTTETSRHNNPHRQRDSDLRREYDIFCHAFTLSGCPQTKRNFDLSMEIEGGEQATSDLATSISRRNRARISHLAEESGSQFENYDHQEGTLDSQIIQSNHNHRESGTQSVDSPCPGMSTSYPDESGSNGKGKGFTISSAYDPQPPSDVITPTVYMEMQRATSKRRLSRQNSVWRPLRSIFSSESLNRQ